MAIRQNARVTRRLRIFTVLIALLAGWLLVGAVPAQAQEQIDRIETAVVVHPDTSMTLTETIDYRFPTGETRHGIVRTLVTSDPIDGGGSWRYGVTVRSVTADGKKVPYESQDDGDLLSVKIGDPNVTVTGTVTYVISYDVTGALRAYTADELKGDEAYKAGDVELYWDLVGSGWDVPIASAVATVTGPAAPLAYGCYAGEAGSTADCAVTEDGATLGFGPVALPAGGALTGVIAYPGSAFTTVPTPDIVQPGLLDDPVSAFLIAVPLGLIALAAPIIAVVVARRRLRGAELSGAPVQFAPPENLRPAQLQASAIGEVDASGALATLLDLVARGHLGIEADDGGLFQRSSITITWRSTNPDDIADWEKSLISAILNGGQSGTLQGYNAAFAAAVQETSKTLVAEATTAGRWSANRNPTWKRGLGIAMAAGMLLLFGGMVLGGVTGTIGLAVIGFAVGFALFIGSVIAVKLVPVHQTPQSAQFLAEYRGFGKLLDTDASEARRELAHRLGLPDYAVFATMLPYAVSYGLDEAWTQAFPDLTPEDLQRTGYNVTSMQTMAWIVATGRTSTIAATTQPGSGRSGDSGFSGGSAGGGGGGGGGGGW